MLSHGADGNRHKKEGATAFAPSSCGETGIRTLGPASWSTVFETAPIDHSGISPFSPTPPALFAKRKLAGVEKTSAKVLLLIELGKFIFVGLSLLSNRQMVDVLAERMSCLGSLAFHRWQ